MDATTRSIAGFSHTLTYTDIPDDVLEHMKQHVVDTLACAMGGVRSENNRIAWSVAPPVPEGADFGCVVGTKRRTTPDMAAFLNSAMIRNLDYNDGFPGGHPSETLGPLLAIAGAKNLSGQQFLTAAVVAYEIHNRIAGSMGFRFTGWDHSTQIAVSASGGLGNLLGLSFEQICHAVSLTAVASVALRATRSGELSLWTAAATGQGAKDAVFLTALAEKGMTAPPAPFEGRHGIWDKMSGKVELKPFPPHTSDFLTRGVRYKYWPAEYNAQISIWAAKQLRETVKFDDIESITIWTYEWAWLETASEPEKWNPTTPDTANHSLPYLFAHMFLHGTLALEAFEESAFNEPAARDLMKRISIRHDKAMDEIYPETIPVRVECRTRSGKSIEVALENPRGHNKNPMSQDETSEKFAKMAEGLLDGSAVEKALAFWWSLDSQSSVLAGLDLLAAGE